MRLSRVIDIDKEKCINCQKCLAVCPVKFCNNASGEYLTVNQDLCIGCGECVRVCTHNARTVIDDIEQAMSALNRKEKLVAIVAPAVAAEFPETYLNLNGWLKSCGVSAVYDVSFGAELTVKTYLEHIKNNHPQVTIAQPCPAIVTYIEIYKPELIKHLAPAHSPMMHTVNMIKHFHPEYRNYKVLVISPCIAKRREFDEIGVDAYNVTMKNLREYLLKRSIDLRKYPASDFDNVPAERAVLFSTPGGLLRTAKRELPEIEDATRKIEGPGIIYHYLSDLEKNIGRNTAPALIDCLNCELGCNGGTGTSRSRTQDELEHAVEMRKRNMQQLYTKKSAFGRARTDLKKLRKNVDSHWSEDLYRRTYKNLHESNLRGAVKMPDKMELEAIFHEMSKFTEKDMLNCSNCGYNSCEEMAVAIFNGLNKHSNCHHQYYQKCISKMLGAFDRLSEGDLTVQIPSQSNDAAGQLYEGFNQTVNSIKQLIRSIISAAETTADAVREISVVTGEVVQGSGKQTMEATEIGSAIEQMSHSITESSRHTNAATETALEAGKMAVEGGIVVSNTINGINRIAEMVALSAKNIERLGSSSQQIGEIVQLINDIADQTNLLALNAAIEAARAGEQGRGFAVVADEIRKLAEKTTKATSEIAVMIRQIQTDTTEAVHSIKQGRLEAEKEKANADKASQALNQIISKTSTVEELIKQAARVSEDQSAASSQISRSICEIIEVSRYSSENSAKIASSADELNNITENLRQLVSQFNAE